MSLPSGYTQLEYIESSGTQWFDTGVKLQTGLTVELDFQCTQYSNDTWFLSVLNVSSLIGMRAGVYQNAFYLTNMAASQNDILTRTIFTGEAAQAYDLSLYLFAENRDGAAYKPSYGRAFALKMWINGTLIRDYVPAKNSSGTIGMLDQVTNVFYTNQGTGAFTGKALPIIHDTIIDGTEYEIPTGKTLVNATGYGLIKGRTLIDGTGYNIPFEKELKVSYTGTHNLYGDMTQGWIEMLSGGVLTLEGGTSFDMYLLGGGANGNKATKPSSTRYRGGNGGLGGLYVEQFGVVLDGDLAVTIGGANSATTVGDYTSASGSRATSSYGYYGEVDMARGTYSAATSGSNGRRPFANNTPMASGFASLALGASGGGGGACVPNYYTAARGAGGSYGGGAGAAGTSSSGVTGGTATANTGSGGGGGGNYNSTLGSGGAGGSGIAIIRWGY